MINQKKKFFVATLVIFTLIGIHLFVGNNHDLNSNFLSKDNKTQFLKNENLVCSDIFNPTPDNPNQNFKWAFWNGTMFGVSWARYNSTEYGSGESYYNITSMPYSFLNVPEFQITNYSYYVQLEEIYFNTTFNKITPVENQPLLNVTFVNFTEPFFIPIIPSFGGGGGGPTPGWYFMFINPFIPMNGSVLALQWCAKQLENWYNMFGMGPFDIKSINLLNRNIYFRNSTSGAFVNLTYDSNGIIKYGEIYYDDGGTQGWTTITITATFDVNPVDDIKWNVNVGDYLHYGNSSLEIQIYIYAIENITFETPGGKFIYQQVIANISIWNGGTSLWEYVDFDGTDSIAIGSANEMHPIIAFGPMLVLLVPNGTEMVDLADEFLSRGEWGPSVKFDQVSYGDNWVRLYNSTNQGYARYQFSKFGNLDILKTEEMPIFFDNANFILYQKNSTVINGKEKISIMQIGTAVNEISVNISVTNDAYFTYTALNINPVNIALKYGALFIDLWLNDTSLLNDAFGEPINITILFDPSVYKDFEIWYFNTSSNDPNEQWQLLNFEDWSNGKVVIRVNHTSIFAFTNVPIAQYILPSEGDDDDDGGEKAVAIPLGNYYLLFLLVGLIGIVLYTKRKVIFK